MRFIRLPVRRIIRAQCALLFVGAVIFLLAVVPSPAAQTTGTPPDSGSSFGQYLVDHQDDLAPFFTQNSGIFLKQAVPLFMGMLGWVVLLTMLVGWGIDVLLSRGFAFLFAPAHADWKRSILYATGRLFLSFIYTCLMALAIVFCLGLEHALLVIGITVIVLLLVALAAQLVWILYLYRTSFGISLVFYIVVAIIHGVAGALLTGPIFASQAPSAITSFIDTAVTPKLRADVDSTRHDLAAAKSDLASVQSRANDLQNRIAQAQTEKGKLQQEIEAKKHSDIYVFAEIMKTRAGGNLASAHKQLEAFVIKFPNSPLLTLAHGQLADLDAQMAAEAAQEKQHEAEAARVAAAARADLLGRAARGAVTLSEMRGALIGKSRDQVKDLLGAPSATDLEKWTYYARMIVNPLTNEKTGLVVNFSEGSVQGVDYCRDSQGGVGGTQ